MKKRSGADTGFKDKDGNPILVHAHVSDAAGAVYYINAYSQAVPKGDGVAVELDRLLQDGEVRVLSAEEVLKLNEPKPAGRGKYPRKPKQEPVRVIREDAGKPEPAKDPAPENEPDSNEIMAELQLVIGTIPDKMLADELRRRGYVFSAVKPVIVNI